MSFYVFSVHNHEQRSSFWYLDISHYKQPSNNDKHNTRENILKNGHIKLTTTDNVIWEKNIC